MKTLTTVLLASMALASAARADNLLAGSPEYGKTIDATALGTTVDAYLVQRAGIADDNSQSVDLELVVTAASGRRVLHVSDYGAELQQTGAAPFGLRGRSARP